LGIERIKEGRVKDERVSLITSSEDEHEQSRENCDAA
jgi:hypothetical protein